MPGFILHAGASISCTHGGQAIPAAPPEPNVLVCGQPVVPQSTGHTITGCANPSNAGGPCIRANWSTASTKVLVNYKRVLLMDSQGLSTPTNLPVFALDAQKKVLAT
ncbi:hypothetical protein [Desulfogranum japonicum]|uniref:hypothetical protein n=1 Tax=Desulfogranum japonicum TaxID=231447 RepID=UPI000416FB37|nr:hypothetical protein [Desulfogranum japonicum]